MILPGFNNKGTNIRKNLKKKLFCVDWAESTIIPDEQTF